MDEIQEEIQDVFRRVFEDDELVVSRELSAEDIEGWDSLMHINLLIAVEASLGIKFATAEIADLKEEGRSVGDMLDLIDAKLANR